MNSCLLLLKQILEKNNIKFVDIDGAVETKRRQTNLNQYNDPQSGVNVLLISKAGTEGVSTFGTRQIFICESQFNPSSSMAYNHINLRRLRHTTFDLVPLYTYNCGNE